MSLARTLPEGRPGQILAVGLAVSVLAAVWLAILAPGLSWYETRQDQLAVVRAEAAHIALLRVSLPALRREVAGIAKQAGPQILLPGNSDEVAGATLQSALQYLAARAGISLDSTTMLPAQPVGALRRIGVEAVATTSWPALVALLGAIDTAQPRMVVDNLALTAPAAPDHVQDLPLQVDFSVAAFRAGGAP